MEKAHGIMFHHFHDEQTHIKGQGSIDSLQFEKMLIWLKSNYNLLSADEWYNKAIQNSLNKKDVCITFDDNLKCQYDIALPILKEFKLKAFWFIYTSPLIGINERLEIYRHFRFSQFNNIDDFYESFNITVNNSKYAELVIQGMKLYNSDEFLKHFPFYTENDKIFRYQRDYILKTEKYYEIMDLMIENSNLDVKQISENLWCSKSEIEHLDKLGHMIGLHSHTHPTALESLSYKEQFDEYKQCHDILSSILSQKIISMSHPCNSYNNDTLKILEKLDVNFGFRANMEDGYNSQFEHPRLDHALLINKI